MKRKHLNELRGLTKLETSYLKILTEQLKKDLRLWRRIHRYRKTLIPEDLLEEED